MDGNVVERMTPQVRNRAFCSVLLDSLHTCRPWRALPLKFYDSYPCPRSPTSRARGRGVHHFPVGKIAHSCSLWALTAATLSDGELSGGHVE